MADGGPEALPKELARYRTRAAALVRSPEKLTSLAGRAARKLASSSGVKLDAVRGDLLSFIELLKAYAAGRYRGVSNRTLIAVATAVLYFVMPLDLIPDFILGLGLVDDAAVIGYVFSRVRAEVNEFVAWQRSQVEEE